MPCEAEPLDYKGNHRHTKSVYAAILTELGIIVREDGQHVRSFPFSNRAREYLEVKSGSARLEPLAALLSSGDVETNNAALLSILRNGSVDARMMDEQDAASIQDNKPAVLVEGGFASNEHDALGKLREFALALSSSRVAEVSGTPDLHIIQAVNSLDETERMANAMFGRLREWYGLHFPELENIVDGMGGYCRVALAGRRDAMDRSTFADAGFPDAKADMLNLVAKTSRGGDITDENLAVIQSMARRVLDLYQTRRDLEDHVEAQMTAAAPNLSAILGPGVGARLLARAGSLRKFALMAASTIQVLGAEKALFRSIKTGSQPPKHGLIFQHALVHRAPRWQRGKIARAVASKAAIAARMDMHEPVLNETLLEKLNVRVVEIGEKYSQPPVRPERPEKLARQGRGAGRPTRRDRPDRDRQSGRSNRRDRPSGKGRQSDKDRGAARRTGGKSRYKGGRAKRP